MVRNIFSKAAGTVLACTASIGLVAGCSTDGTAVKGDAGAASTTHAADPAKVRALVLTPKDFPAGYAIQDVPVDKLQDTLSDTRAGLKEVTFDPAECGDLNAAADVDYSKAGVVVAIKGVTDTLTEMISVGGTSVADYREQVTGECASMSMTAKMSGEKVSSRITQKVLDGPDVDAAESLVVESVNVTKVAGRTVETRTITGVAEVEGYLVNVSALTMAPGGEASRADFEALFTKAVAKVADQA